MIVEIIAALALIFIGLPLGNFLSFLAGGAVGAVVSKNEVAPIVGGWVGVALFWLVIVVIALVVLI